MIRILRVHRKGCVILGHCGAPVTTDSFPLGVGCGQEVKGDVHSLLITNAPKNEFGDMNLLCVACAEKAGLKWKVEDAY